MNFREVNKKLNEIKQSGNKQALEQFRNTKISNGGLMKKFKFYTHCFDCGSGFKAVNFWSVGVFNKPRWI